MDTFKYDLNARRGYFTDAELTEPLKAYGASVGNRPFTMREFKKSGLCPCYVQLYAVQFGSWRKALERVGIQGGRVRNADPAELIDDLDRVWRKLGYPPGTNRINQHGQFSPNTYTRVWGSIRRACKLLADFHNGKISRAELLASAKPRDKRRRIPPSVRWDILKRDNFTCTACGACRISDPSVRLHVDHIHPISKGGTDDPSNLRTLCSKCNQGKGDRE